MDVARNTALKVLIEFDKSGVFPNLSLKKHLREINDIRDRAFICALVYGVIEKRLLLDYYIGRVSSVKLKKINVAVINILRLGLYQIKFLSTPISAACNTSVELAKKNGQYKSAAFVNAILRKLSTDHVSIKLPDKSSDDYYSIKYSLSKNIAKKLLDIFGTEGFERFMQSDIDNKSTYIAVNTLKVTTDELISLLKLEKTHVEKTDIIGLLKISDSGNIENSSAFKSGLYHVIGRASFCAARALDPKPGDKIIDMCAAPGGKTFAISYLCENSADITAFDLHEHKIKNLVSDCKRLGITSIKPLQKDSTLFDGSLLECADRILCDVPCSGLGMIFKKPDIKYNDIDFNTLTDIQYKILCNASRYLKKGGRLVYSTCTVNPDENENLVNKFICENSGFSIDKNVQIIDNVFGEYTFLPHRGMTDGFYIAVITKN